MHQDVLYPIERSELYPLLIKQLVALVQDCPPISALANASALLWQALPDINWAGFYLLKEQILYLGPFQGKPACTMIPVGRGVCGTAAATRQIQLVPDVHQFPGHIACDSASNSEVVVPLQKDGRLLGVLDIDSPVIDRFDDADAKWLNAMCDALIRHVDWSKGLL